MSFLSKLSDPLKNSPFYARPLCLFCSVFLLTVLAVKLSYAWFLVIAVLVCLYSAVLFVSNRERFGFKNPLAWLVLVSMLCGTAVSFPGELAERRAESMCGESKTVRVTVTETLYSEVFGSAHYVKITEIDGDAVNVNGILEIPEQYEVFPFDTVTVSGEVSSAVLGLSGAELYNAKAKGTCLTVVSNNIENVTHEEHRTVGYLIYRIRTALCERFDRLIGTEASAYAKALLIGEKSGLPDDFRKDMSALGVSHILAVSGMHMSIIAAIVAFLADRIRTARKLKSVLITVGAVLFMTVAGFSPSVVRAAIMLVLSVLSVFFGRKGDSLTALFLSGAIICAVSPRTALSCSFLLSFFATLGLVLCASAVSRGLAKRFYVSRAGDMKLGMRALRGFLSSVAVSLCATLFTAPILSIYFSEISYFAVLANLFAVPCAFVSVVLAVVLMLLGDIPLLGGGAAAAFRAVYSMLKAFASFCSDNLETSLSLGYRFFLPILMLVICVLVFMRLNGIRSVSALLAVMIVASLVFVTCVQIYSVSVSERNEVVYLSDKSSEALLVSSGSETMLIDIGKGGKSVPTFGTEMMQSEYYETRPDAFMLTHYHSLHISTVRHLIRNYRIKRIYLPTPESENDEKIYRSIQKYLSETETVVYTRGEDVEFGSLSVSTAQYSLLERSTHPVSALRISDGKRSLLWVGSSVTESEVALSVNRWLSESSVVIVGSHGPKEKENIPYYTVIPSVTEIFLSPYVTCDGVKLFGGIYFESLEADSEGVVEKRFRLGAVS